MATPWTCSACGKTFGGLSGFDAHRVGEYIDRHPDYGRRRLSPGDFRAKGYHQTPSGKWQVDTTEAETEQLRILKGLQNSHRAAKK